MYKCEKCGYDCGGTGDSAHHCTNRNWIGGMTNPLNTGKGLTAEEIINSIPKHVFRKQETKNGNLHTYDDTGKLVSVVSASLVPSILQLQADPFPTESDALAEQGFIEQDASAPIKEQCEENARLMRENAALKAQRNADAAQYKAIGAELAKITMLEKQFTDDLDRVKAQMDALECENCRILTENAELAEKAKRYEDACKAMANCLHELEG